MFWFVLANLLGCPECSSVFWNALWCLWSSKAPSIHIWIFLKTDIIFPFSKKYASTRSVFESFSPVHMKTLKRWKYDSMPYWEMRRAGRIWCMVSYSNTSVFARPHTAISKKVVEKSARDTPERDCGWFWVHCSSKKFERMARETMDICLWVLKESNKSRFDS